MTTPHSATAGFRTARDLLLRHREDYVAAAGEFSWPQLTEFNWALDWFDVIAAEHPGQEGLRVVTEDAVTSLTFGELAARSSKLANWLRGLGAELRTQETARLSGTPDAPAAPRGVTEFWEEDFPQLKG